MKDTDVQIHCGCDGSTRCPQGRTGAGRQCVVIVPEDDLFRIVMQLPEFKRRYTVANARDGAVPADSESNVEEMIQEKGLNAPRLNPDMIDETIVDERYHVFRDTTVTVCCLILRNGFCVIGESAAASPENFDEEVGRTIARRNARDKIWSLEGYLLKERLALAAKGA